MRPIRGGSGAAATSKMERFVIIVNGWKHSVLDVAAVLDQPLNHQAWTAVHMHELTCDYIISYWWRHLIQVTPVPFHRVAMF